MKSPEQESKPRNQVEKTDDAAVAETVGTAHSAQESPPESLQAEMRWVETAEVARLLPSTYYPTAVQIGGVDADYLATLSCGVRFQFFDQMVKDVRFENTVLVNYAAVPLPARSIDLAVLPHLLERAQDPTHILREISQTISANGVIAITGFNPMSLFGLKTLLAKPLKKFRKTADAAKHAQHLRRMGQIQDWLSLLSFELRAASVFYYKPPLLSTGVRARFERLEKAGARWWPAAGAIYVLVARKREIGARLLPVRKHKVVRLEPRIAKPLTRNKPSVSRSVAASSLIDLR